MVTLVYVWYAIDLILTRLLPICNLETYSVLISPVPRLKKITTSFPLPAHFITRNNSHDSQSQGDENVRVYDLRPIPPKY